MEEMIAECTEMMNSMNSMYESQPEKFFIDKQGQIRAVVIGPGGEAEYRRQLETLLAEP